MVVSFYQQGWEGEGRGMLLQLLHQIQAVGQCHHLHIGYKKKAVPRRGVLGIQDEPPCYILWGYFLANTSLKTTNYLEFLYRSLYLYYLLEYNKLPTLPSRIKVVPSLCLCHSGAALSCLGEFLWPYIACTQAWAKLINLLLKKGIALNDLG